MITFENAKWLYRYGLHETLIMLNGQMDDPIHLISGCIKLASYNDEFEKEVIDIWNSYQ